MTAEQLKASVLQAAIEGSLTECWREQNGVKREDWSRKKFSDLGSLERGRSKHRPRNAPELFGGPYPFIQTGDVANADMYVTQHVQTLSETGLEQSKLFKKGTLCITIAANIGKVAILTYDCCFPDSVVGFTPNDLILPEIMYFFMSSLQKRLEAIAPSTAQKNINLKLLNSLEFEVPSKAEQIEIVRAVSNILPLIRDYEKAHSALKNAEQALPDQLRASLLQEAIQGKLVPQLDDEPAVDIAGEEPDEVPFAIPEKWKWVRLSDVGEKLQYGYTASAQTSGKVKLLRITDITERGVSWDSVPFCAINEEDVHKFKLQANDILIARTGGTIGKSFRIDSINCLSVFASYLIRVRVFSHLIFPEYVELYLGCPWYWEQLRDKSRGTGQPNVNAKSLGQLLIPLPPLAEQRRIVARLEALLPHVDAIAGAKTRFGEIE